MNIFGMNIEADIHVLEYTQGEAFLYQEIESITATHNRIEISVLINLKHDVERKDINLKLTMAYIKNDSVFANDEGKNLQSLTQLQIWTKNLDSMSDVATVIPKPRNSLIRDIWNYRYSIKLNLSDLPILDCGTYAIVLYAESQPQNNLTVLDCSYFEIK